MSNHRLHDFVELGGRIFIAIDEERGRFVRLMDDMRRESGAELAAGDSFILAIRALLRKLLTNAITGVGVPGWKSWFPEGVVAIRLEVGGAVVGIRSRSLAASLTALPHQSGSDFMPRNERELNGAVLRTMPILADIGIEVAKRELSKGHPYWEFRMTSQALDRLVGEQ